MSRASILIATDTGLAYGRGITRGVINYANFAKTWTTALTHYEGVLTRLETMPPHGLIIQSRTREMSQAIAHLGIKAVNIADNEPGHCLPTVISNHNAIAAAAFEHMLSRGVKSFGFTGPGGHYYAEQRLAGFQAAMAHAGLAAEQLIVHMPQSDIMYPGEILSKVGGLPRPVGIFAADDYWARETINAALTAELRVPEDVAVVGVDNDELLCESSAVPLSSVEVSAERIGFEAATLLSRLLKGEQIDPGPYLIPPKSVFVRQSSDIMAIEDDNIAVAINFVTENAHRPIGVEDILDQLAISRRQLEKRFRTVLGRSPAAEIRRTRIEAAKKLMDTTSLTLAQIARQTGFADVSFLGKSFRRETGMTPSQYRKRTKPAAE